LSKISDDDGDYDDDDDNNNNCCVAQGREISGHRWPIGPYIFEPIAVETLGIHNESARQLLTDLGSRISESSGDAGETSFLFQRISVLVQRFNAVLLHDSLPVSDFTD